MRPILRSGRTRSRPVWYLLAPNLSKEAQPVLAHRFADLGFWPTCLFHSSRQVGKFTKRAYPCRVHDLAKRTGDAPSVSLVVAYILEERVVLTLRKVGADPDIVLAGDADHVVDGGDVILDRRLVSSDVLPEKSAMRR